MADLAELESTIGHTFARKEILLRALTHSSHSHEHSASEVAHNEQLEFLGDSILGFVVSRELVQRFPSFSEGQLSKMKAHLVSAQHLFSIAKALDLGEYLQLGRGEEKSGGRHKRALLVDAFEALIAALYLDAGLQKTERVIQRLVLQEFLETGVQTFAFTDHKSALQEYLQAARRAQPRYVVVDERGPEHRKTFIVEVRVGRTLAVRAEGPTKKTAEQEAARTALIHLKERDQAKAAAETAEESTAEAGN